jgi:hypothetical protein
LIPIVEAANLREIASSIGNNLGFIEVKNSHEYDGRQERTKQFRAKERDDSDSFDSSSSGSDNDEANVGGKRQVSKL